MNYNDKKQKLEALIAEMQMSKRELSYWCLQQELHPLASDSVIKTPLPVVYYLGRCVDKHSPEYKNHQFKVLPGLFVSRVKTICGAAVPTGQEGRELRFLLVNTPLATFDHKAAKTGNGLAGFQPPLAKLKTLWQHKEAFNETMLIFREFGVDAEDLVDGIYFGNSSDVKVYQTSDNGRFLAAGALDFTTGEQQLLNPLGAKAYRRLCI